MSYPSPIALPVIEARPCWGPIHFRTRPWVVKCKRPHGHSERCEPAPREGEFTAPSFEEIRWKKNHSRSRKGPRKLLTLYLSSPGRGDDEPHHHL